MTAGLPNPRPLIDDAQTKREAIGGESAITPSPLSSAILAPGILLVPGTVCRPSPNGSMRGSMQGEGYVAKSCETP